MLAKAIRPRHGNGWRIRQFLASHLGVAVTQADGAVENQPVRCGVTVPHEVPLPLELHAFIHRIGFERRLGLAVSQRLQRSSSTSPAAFLKTSWQVMK